MNESLTLEVSNDGKCRDASGREWTPIAASQPKTEDVIASSSANGSAASPPTCDFCGNPATKEVRRIITNRFWNACDACIEKRRMNRGPYQTQMLPNAADLTRGGDEPKI